ncbi:DUF1929 domain-containing protein [Cryobacterium sinapicolor]|uniref:DUF1929 domain-containing protein n=1 Tax=Cryobacterium sinapicolor TaxID=1259236 RepID=A0ABY2JIJ4_9MICO|nr:DUF1929 domain-containing protein [Cryobacterium sinapicolor]
MHSPDRDDRGRQPRTVDLNGGTERDRSIPLSAAARSDPTGSKGTWGATIGFPLVPAVAALLPGNKLLTWSSYSTTTFGGANGRTAIPSDPGVVVPGYCRLFAMDANGVPSVAKTIQIG